MGKTGIAIAGVLLGLSACASQGPTDNPVLRIGTWFSYLNGDDLRAACVPGAPARYRLVYNADYDQQVRTYDVVPVVGGEGATLEQRVFASGADVRGFKLSDPGGMLRGERASTRLAPAEVAALDAALGESGFDRPAPAGRTLFSNSFYWIVQACRGGRFQFNAYTPEDRGYAGMPFPAVLERLDRTGVPFNQPRTANDFKAVRPAKPNDLYTVYFELRVGPNGLVL